MSNPFREGLETWVTGVAVAILLIVLICLVVIVGRNVQHSRCYYDNPDTECGKTIYCPTHLNETRCLELNGTWERETGEREQKEWNYWTKEGIDWQS